MSYDISLYRIETKLNEQKSNDEDFFEHIENMVLFSEGQYQYLQERLKEYNYIFQNKTEYGLFFEHEEYGTALLADEALYFTTSFDEETIFEVGLIASEFTDTGEFAKYDPQNEGWEEII